MKILVFADTHGSKTHLERIKVKSKEADLIICSGDITLFAKHQKEILEHLDSFNKTIIITHGNHEEESSLRRMCSKTKNIKYIHNEAIIIEDITIIGHGGGGFSSDYPDFKQNIKQFIELSKKTKKTTLLTHAPPFESKLDEMNKGWHVGAASYKEFIDKAQPDYALSGHIHENFGKKDKIGKTTLINPGPNGEIINI